MKVFYSDAHLAHQPRYYFPEGGQTEPFLETPERAECVVSVLHKADWAEVVPPEEFGLEPILSVHSAPYLDYLRTPPTQNGNPAHPSKGRPSSLALTPLTAKWS